MKKRLNLLRKAASPEGLPLKDTLSSKKAYANFSNFLFQLRKEWQQQ
jgi:hypothetical protein